MNGQRHGTWRARARWTRNLLALAAALLLAAAPAQEARIALDDRAYALERVERMMGLLEEFRGTLDRTQFDVDALALEMAFEEPESISAWMQEQIAFEPYAGLLRGPEGTLLARAGNALDQATLLARLLGDAGYEARVALATLSEADAGRLLARASLPRAEPPPPGDVDAMHDVLTRLEGLMADSSRLVEDLEATLDPPAVDGEALLAELDATAGRLQEALARADVTLGAGAEPALVQEARNYAWTQYRLGPSEAWSSAHPTGFDPQAPLEAEEVITDEVPEELLHRVRIEAWIERKEGDRLVREEVMSAWERPAANAHGVLLSYANAPNGYQPSTLGAFDLEEVLESTTFFAPYFGGSMAPGAQVFDLDGRTVPPDVAGDAAAAVFQTVAGQAEQAAGALGALGNDGPDEDADELMALVGHGLDFVTIAPGGEETRYRRRLLDRLGPENRAADRIRVPEDAPDATAAVLGRQRILVTVGALPTGYLLDRTLERILESRPFFEFIVAQMAEPDHDATLAPELVPGDTALDHLLANDLFDRALALEGGEPGFRAGPSMLVLAERIDPEGGSGFVRSVDIVSNPRRVLRGEGNGAARIAADAALRRGVWETIVEREMLADEDGTITAAADAGGPFQVFRPGQEVDAAALGGDAEAAENLLADLARGHVVLVPTATPDGDRPAWWRIDPLSGTTLGITADGRGQTMIEYEIQLYDYALTLMFAVKGLKDCQGMGGTAEMCCLLKAHITNVAGFGMGGIVGKAFGAGGGLLFTLGTGIAGVDFAGGMGLECSEFGAGA